jgi:hypothetical protein
MTDSKICMERNFDVTEMDTLENGKMNGGGEGSERKQSDVWTEGSRGSSQEVLVREIEPGTAR